MPALVLTAERWNDIVILYQIGADAAGADQSSSWTLPAGIGDIAVMEIMLMARTIATMVTTPEVLGAELVIVSSDGGTIVDIVGVVRYQRTTTATKVSAYVSPDPLVLWRQNESLRLVTPELDTNGAPTGDYEVIVKAVRVRPVEGPAAPLQLVR